MTRAFIPSVGHDCPTSMDGYLTPHPQAFVWSCPYPGCGFGPTDLEGAHQHLNAVHYTKESNA